MKKQFYRFVFLAAVCLSVPFCLSCIPEPAALPVCQRTKTPKQNSLTNTFLSNQKQADAVIDAIAQRYQVKGCSVAAFEGQEVVYAYSYGMARPGLEANNETRYRCASVSKLVSTVLALQLVEQGKLSLNADIAQINPGLKNPDYPNTPATLEMLLTHTSGIVDGPAWQYAVSQDPFPPLDAVLNWGVFSGARPGTTYQYSNLAFGLVAALVERASGQPFGDYARDALLQPMGLDAGYLTDYLVDRKNVAAMRSDDPLSYGDMAPQYRQIAQGQMYLMAQCELYISAQDLAKIAMILAGDGTYLGKRYLTQESLEELHTQRLYDGQTNTARGLAVQISDDLIDGLTLYGHQGNAYGAIACVFYERKSNRGIVFLSNDASDERVESQIYAVNDAVIKALWPYLEGKQK